MKRLFLAALFSVLATQASAEKLFGKPVVCYPDTKAIVKMSKDNNAEPMMAFSGFAWEENGDAKTVNIYVITNIDTGSYVVVEQVNNAFFCVLSAGNVILLDQDVMKELLNWNTSEIRLD